MVWQPQSSPMAEQGEHLLDRKEGFLLLQLLAECRSTLQIAGRRGTGSLGKDPFPADAHTCRFSLSCTNFCLSEACSAFLLRAAATAEGARLMASSSACSPSFSCRTAVSVLCATEDIEASPCCMELPAHRAPTSWHPALPAAHRPASSKLTNAQLRLHGVSLRQHCEVQQEAVAETETVNLTCSSTCSLHSPAGKHLGFLSWPGKALETGIQLTRWLLLWSRQHLCIRDVAQVPLVPHARPGRQKPITFSLCSFSTHCVKMHSHDACPSAC